MKLPFVSRLAYENQAKLVELQREQIASLKEQVEQLKGLFDKTSQFEIVEQGETTVTLRSKAPVATAGRAGWRTKRAEHEAGTRPVPADSMQALEKRVAEQGGKV